MENRTLTSLLNRLLVVVCPLLLVLTSLESWAGTVTLNKSGTGTGAVTSLPTGINCGPTCSSQSFSFKTTVTLVAFPAATTDGSKFSGWIGCTPIPLYPLQCTVSASSVAKSVYAKFDLRRPVVELKGVDTIAIESTLKEGAFVVSRQVSDGFYDYPLMVLVNIATVVGVTNACPNFYSSCIEDFSMYNKVGAQIVPVFTQINIPAGAKSQKVYIKPIKHNPEWLEGSEPVKLYLATFAGGNYAPSGTYYQTTIWIKDFP